MNSSQYRCYTWVALPAIQAQVFWKVKRLQKWNLDSTQGTLDFLAANDADPEINFAWENNGYHENLMKIAKQMVADTTVVVVIGYSFPSSIARSIKKYLNV